MSISTKPSAKEMRNAQEALDALVSANKEAHVSKKDAWQYLRAHILSFLTAYDAETKECGRLGYHASVFVIKAWRLAAITHKASNSRPFSAEALWNMAVILDGDLGRQEDSDAPPATVSRSKPKAKKGKAESKAKAKATAKAKSEAKAKETKSTIARIDAMRKGGK